MRSRGNLAKPQRRNASWRRRRSALLFGRALVGVLAIIGLFALGKANDVADHGPYVHRPATEVERLTHDLLHEYDLDQVDPDRNGWGSD